MNDDDDVTYIEIGPEDPEDKQKNLKMRLVEALLEIMSEKGVSSFENLLHEFNDVTRVRLANDAPADVKAMRVEIDSKSKPIIATSFSMIDFVIDYWKLPLDDTSQPLHDFIAHKGTYVPARVIQGG